MKVLKVNLFGLLVLLGGKILFKTFHSKLLDMYLTFFSIVLCQYLNKHSILFHLLNHSDHIGSLFSTLICLVDDKRTRSYFIGPSYLSFNMQLSVLLWQYRPIIKKPSCVILGVRQLISKCSLFSTLSVLHSSEQKGLTSLNLRDDPEQDPSSCTADDCIMI